MIDRDIEKAYEECKGSLAELSRIVIDGRNPPAGPYAFFHHASHCLERLADCRRVVKRMISQRAELTRCSRQRDKSMPSPWPAGTPYPDEVQKVSRRESELIAYMKQDMETLYMFGVILLDQWSIQAATVASVNIAKRHPFYELVGEMEHGAASLLGDLWSENHEKFLWLFYQLRFYRNRFVVHGNRPWQRGTTMSVYGADFSLHTPSPPGWLDDDALDAEIMAMMHLAPEAIRNAPDDYWEKRPGRLIEVLFDHIGNVEERTDRERIAELFGKKGGSTPSFVVLAERLFECVQVGTTLLLPIAESNIENIDLGEPHETSAPRLRRFRS